MNKMVDRSNLTQHAKERMMQRAIDELVTSLVLEFGDAHTDSDGCTYTELRKKKLCKKIARKLKRAANKLERQDGVFVVESEVGSIVTVGHTYTRHKR